MIKIVYKDKKNKNIFYIIDIAKYMIDEDFSTIVNDVNPVEFNDIIRNISKEVN